MSSTRLLVLVLAGAAAAHAAPGVVQQATLLTSGAGPYFALQVPLAVQTRAASPRLDDLQLLNARGEPLPWAWADAPTGAATLVQTALRPFALPGPASGAATLPSRSWLLDARAVRGTLLHLELVLDEHAQGAFTLQVEASPDLQQWRTLNNAAPVLALQREGLRLQRSGIDLGGVAPGYLRLTAAPGSLLPALQSVQVSSTQAVAAAQPVQWSEPLAPQSCDERGCDYALPAHVPLDQVELLPAEANTVAQVSWSVDDDDPLPRTDDARRRHDLHHPLRALRHKGDGAPAPVPAAAPVRTLATASVFWLQLPAGETRSGPTWLGGGVHPRLHLQVAGPLSLLGHAPPRIRVGTRTRVLVFLARGPAPYRLAWGGVDAPRSPASAAAAGPLALDQLMPTRRAGDPLPPFALVALDDARAAPVLASAASSAGKAAANVAAAPAQPAWLWAVLVAGVLAMGLMARTLLRKESRDE